MLLSITKLLKGRPDVSDEEITEAEGTLLTGIMLLSLVLIELVDRELDVLSEAPVEVREPLLSGV